MTASFISTLKFPICIEKYSFLQATFTFSLLSVLLFTLIAFWSILATFGFFQRVA